MASSAAHELRRSSAGIAGELWSPEELFNADPQADVLQPVLKPLTLDSRRFYAFRLSLALAPFEVLQEYWAPPDVRTGLLNDTSTLNATCVERRWDGRPDASTAGTIAEQCKGTSFFRFSSALAGRTFAVDRSAAHVQTLVTVLRYSFPHLLFPGDGEPNHATCNVLLQLIARQWSALGAYLPLLYFLFEVQERAFSAFFKQLGTLVQSRKANDSAGCDALKPKKGGKMFSWFSSKPKEAELGVNEKLEMMNTHKATLPVAFEKRYMVALAEHEQISKMQLFCREYIVALRGEASAYQAFAEGLTANPVASGAVSGWYAPAALEAASKGDAAVRQVAASVQRFALRRSSLDAELLLPLLKAIAECESEIGVLSSSQVAYYEELALRTKVVSENTTLVSGKVPLPAGCDASTRPESMAAAREVTRRYTFEFSDWRQHFEAEVAYADAAIKTRIRRLCILCGSIFKTEASCTNAEYYEEYLRPPAPRSGDGGAEASAVHPLQACLGVGVGEGESTYTMDRDDA